MVSGTQKLKYFIKIFCYILFLILSFNSLKDFLHGSVIYETIYNFDNKDVPFPSITLCPSIKTNNLVNLKINDIAKDFNLEDSFMKSYLIYGTLKGINANLIEIVKNYSFTYNDSFYMDHMVAHAFGQKSKIRIDANSMM